MKRGFVVTGLIFALTGPNLAQRRELRGYDPSTMPAGKDESEKRILATLDQVMKTHQTYLNVPVADGRALRLLTEAVGAKSVVEIRHVDRLLGALVVPGAPQNRRAPDDLRARSSKSNHGA